jgi:hypothetical protein
LLSLQIVEFSIRDNSYTEWTLQHMYKFPSQWQRSLHKIRQIMYNPRNVNQIVVHTARSFTILDKTEVGFIVVLLYIFIRQYTFNYGTALQHHDLLILQ